MSTTSIVTTLYIRSLSDYSSVLKMIKYNLCKVSHINSKARVSLVSQSTLKGFITSVLLTIPTYNYPRFILYKPTKSSKLRTFHTINL